MCEAVWFSVTGDRVVLCVNNLGALSCLEMAVVTRAAINYLSENTFYVYIFGTPLYLKWNLKEDTVQTVEGDAQGSSSRSLEVLRLETEIVVYSEEQRGGFHYLKFYVNDTNILVSIKLQELFLFKSKYIHIIRYYFYIPLMSKFK